MKKVISIFALVLILLTACESQAYKENVEKGKEALEDEKYKNAITSFETALDEKEDEEIKKLLKKAKNKLEEQEKVQSYVDQIKNISSEILYLSEEWDQLRNSSASGEIDDETLGTIIYTNIIPLNGEIIDEIEAIEPPNEEIINIHEILITLLNKQQEAFMEIIAAIDEGDFSKITSANALLTEVRKKDREYTNELEKLTKKYNISID